MGSCFSCNKRMMVKALSFGSRKEILRAGYQPPDEMSEHDKLCKSCLIKIRDSQVKGKEIGEARSMAWQMFLTIIAPGWAALMIEKWQKFVVYSLLSDLAIIIGLIYCFAIIDNTIFLVFAIIFYFVSPLDFYWIHKWTKEWNEDKI